MKKSIDAVKMVRGIRDKLYQKTKHMTSQELIQFYREAARKMHAQHMRTNGVPGTRS